MIRMLIADDHPIVSRRIKQLLEEEFPAALFSVVSDTESLISHAQNNEWDIVISDLAMPGGGGLYALKKIKQTKPSLPVIIISIYPEEQYRDRLIAEGAAAFVNKNSADGELANAVKHSLRKISNKAC